MTYDELNEAIIEKLDGQPGDYVTRIDCCYIDNYNMPFDEYTSYELFSYDGETITWFNDWYEGQNDCHYSMLEPFDSFIKAWENVLKIKKLDGWPEDCWNEVMKILGI